MDPVSQILSQSGAGSAQGQGFGQFAAQGAQIAQEGRRLNLMERRQQFEEQQSSMLMPLQMEAQRLNNERTGLAVQSAMKSLEQQNAVMSKMPDLIDLQTQFSASPNGFQDPDLINRASTIFKQAPMLTETDIGKSILGGIQTAPKLDQAFKMFERMNRVTPEGTIPQSFDPQTGRMTFMAEPRAANQPANLQEASAITNLRRRIAQTTDPAIKADLEMELNDVLATTGGQVTTEEFKGPNGETLFRRTIGGRGQSESKLPASTLAKAEEVAVSAPNLLRFGKDIIRLAKPENVGLRGNVNRISAELGGQIAPEFAEAGEEFDFSQAVTFFRGNATKILKSDSQITEDERKAIISDLPSKGFMEAPATAQRKAQGAMRKVGESARRQLQRAGVPLPPHLMTPEEIMDAIVDGKIPEAEGRKLAKESIFVE